jgi:hypothetical protein
MFDLTPLTVFMRFLHLACMATLVGGLVFARLVMTHTLRFVPPEVHDALEDRAVHTFRPLAIVAMIGLALSGIYQFYSSTGHSLRHNLLFGLKMALALHLFSAAILMARPGNPRRVRIMSGAVISGLAIVLISALLRQIY